MSNPTPQEIEIINLKHEIKRLREAVTWLAQVAASNSSWIGRMNQEITSTREFKENCESFDEKLKGIIGEKPCWEK
jgi:ribosomal protein S2